jgi:hypothetical protein
MQLDDVLASRGAVQTVDVLCDQPEPVRPALEIRQGPVSVVGQDIRQSGDPEPVELPHAFRVASEGLRRGQLHGRLPPPEAALTAEGRDSAFGRDARPRQDCDPGGAREDVRCFTQALLVRGIHVPGPSGHW